MILKKSKVVMLPTENESEIALAKNKLFYELIPTGMGEYKLQHFYILSEDKIEEGDAILYNIHSNELYQGYNKFDERTIVTNYNKAVHQNIRYCHKIISSTDISLNLPFPSEDFILKFISKYNKNTPITEVIVEYEDYSVGVYENRQVNPKLKVKDNSITIKKVKDSFNLKEVRHLASNFALAYGNGYKGSFDSWYSNIFSDWEKIANQ